MPNASGSTLLCKKNPSRRPITTRSPLVDGKCSLALVPHHIVLVRPLARLQGPTDKQATHKQGGIVPRIASRPIASRGSATGLATANRTSKHKANRLGARPPRSKR